MFKNFLKIAFRNLMRNKFYTILNILGLSIGLIAAILITLYVRHELIYDRHYTDHNRIYRLESHFNIQGSDDYFAVTSFPLAPALKLEYPQIEDFTRFTPMDNNVFKYEDNTYYNDDVFYADSSAFRLFDHKFVHGNPETALMEPNSIVLTESMSNSIFGEIQPLGKVIDTGYGIEFTVTGVIEDIVETSHLKYDALCSMVTLANDYLFGRQAYESLHPNMFWNVGHFSYVKLKENASMTDVIADYARFDEKYIAPVGQTLNATFEMLYQPLADVHLSSGLGFDQAQGNAGYIQIFIIIGIFLLLIGSINYMNLSTAQSIGRSVEVGIRKVLGANRSTIRNQFLVESVLIALFSMLLAYAISYELLPLFGNLAGMNFTFNFPGSIIFFLGLIGLALLIGLVSGSYPAFFLASFVPVKVLKGKDAKSGKNIVRKLLVLIQFTISIVLIVGTLIINNQMSYIKDKDLGFDKNNLITMAVRDTFAMNNILAFKEELQKIPAVDQIGLSTSVPGGGQPIIVQRYETADGSMAEKAINFMLTDQEYLELMKFRLIKGRFFSDDMETDKQDAVIINEAAAKALGWGMDAIGKKIGFGARPDGSSTRNTEVIGIYKDFHYQSLHNKVDPMLILPWEEPPNGLSIKLDGRNIEQTLDQIESIWSKFSPNFPFEYRFLDDIMEDFYAAEKRMNTIYTMFSLLCIFIACLGLLGLASFTTKQRYKEIGIRKVMGASTSQITYILVKDFLIWVLFANVIAWPIAYISMNKWLDNFAYRIMITDHLLLFLLSGLIALLIAFFTISYHSINASQVNPAETLKYE